MAGAGASGSTTVSLGAVAAGTASLTASAPGTGGRGYVDVTLAVPEYLRYAWNGTTLTDPVVRGSFGVYSQTGNSRRIIYRREMR